MFFLCPLLPTVLTMAKNPIFCFLVIRLPGEYKGREIAPPSPEVTKKDSQSAKIERSCNYKII